MASSRKGALLAIVPVLIALGAGCGDSSDGGPDARADRQEAEASFPVTVRDGTRSVTIAERPERIVSLSPSATETLFAIGAGDQVIAVDDQSDYPAGVPRTKLSSYEPNVEAIAGYRPDLVVLTASAPRDVIGGLRRLGLAVLAQPVPEKLDEAYSQMRQLGTVTGRPEAGRRVAQRVRSRVERTIAAAPRDRSLKVFHELGTDLYSASSTSFIGRIYARLGLRNVADQAAAKTGSPYPQLSAEAIVSANPDLVVLADSECCGQTPEKARRRPGWAGLSAVRRDAVVAIDDDVASRWGPRVAVFTERVVKAMRRARSGERRP
jgi:iron complex transport system substrate-binding protein